jgi:CRISPR-associated endonuclease Csn1
MARIFGFDIGTTSIGFAVIDHDATSQTGDIRRLGVRIFPEARDPDGTPLNHQRRQKRMARRQLRRRRVRRRALNEFLAEAGLLPAYGTGEWQDLMKTEPLSLRVRGLTDPLTPHELGRALYHLAQRRHFKGRDLVEEENEAETPDEMAAKTNRELTLKSLKTSGETLGQFLHAKGRHERSRGVHANRSSVQEEFKRLWEAQSPHHKALRDLAFRTFIDDTIFAQRPVFWRKNTLGECRFMPGEPLCPMGSWLSQQRRMLEKLNNLALVGGNARPLERDERKAILEKLQTQAVMTWNGVRSALKPIFKARGEPGREKSLRFNLEPPGGDSKLLGNAVEAKLAEIFGEAWLNHPHRQAIRDAVHQRLWEADYGKIGSQRVVIRSEPERRKLRAIAANGFVTDFDVTAEQAAALCDLKLPTGWEPYSTAAIQHFMPHLEEGVRFGTLVNSPELKWQEWRAQTFPSRRQPTGEILDRLPSPAHKEEQKRITALRNPTVVRTQNELRKVVNNLIGLYGKPDLIRIEVTREVGKSKQEREDMSKGNKKQERRRKEAAVDLQSKGIGNPSSTDVDKWILWKECGEFDPYSGRPMSFDDLFRTALFDVEHIWPRSKSFDNSLANKTLCLKELNVQKANKTPYDAFHNNPTWERMKERVWNLVDDGKMAKGKAKRFCREQPLDDDFTSRQLNDTGFAALQAIAFLKRLWPDIGINAPVTVQAVTGRVTAQLRKLWGLNNILSDSGAKTRADHRHHAIDALVVACTHPGMTQKLSAYWQTEDDPNAFDPQLDPPWKTIRADAERMKEEDEIAVSHRVRKKISGPLHVEMPLGYTGRNITKNGIVLGIFVKRVPVEKLTVETLKITGVEDLSQTKFVVRDDGVRQTLLAHLEATNLPAAKSYPPYPRTSSNGPEIRTVRVLMVKQQKLMVPTANGFADTANNHHIAIYRMPNGDVYHDVVSLFKASGRLAKREPIVQRKRHDGAVLIMSLSPGDALELPGGEMKGVWIVGGAWANGQVVLERANDAAHATTTRPRPSALVDAGARKISVDPIGRIRRAND